MANRRQGTTPFIAAIVLLILLLPMAVYAQEENVQEESEKVKDQERGFIGYFKSVYQKTQEAADRRDEFFWGPATAGLPEGFGLIEFSVRNFRVDDAFDEDGKQTDSIFSYSPTDDRGQFFELDAKFESKGADYLLNLAYGLNDSWLLYLAVPFRYQKNRVVYDFEPGTGAAIGLRTKKEMFNLLNRLGRPNPISSYESKAWEIGDIRVGADWNAYRSSWLSLATGIGVGFPTGRLADPNEALIYGLGAQRDTGQGAFFATLNQGVDLRMPGNARFLIFSGDLDYTYRIQGQRRSPRFETPNPNAVATLQALGADPVLYTDISDLSDHHGVTPGSAIDFRGLAYFEFHYAAFGLGYDLHWQQEAQVDSDSDGFEKMLNLLGSYDERQRGRAIVTVSVPFDYLGIPLAVVFEGGYPVQGKNALRLIGDYKAIFRLELPY